MTWATSPAFVAFSIMIGASIASVPEQITNPVEGRGRHRAPDGPARRGCRTRDPLGAAGAKALPLRGRIAFRDVDFHYASRPDHAGAAGRGLHGANRGSASRWWAPAARARAPSPRWCCASTTRWAARITGGREGCPRLRPHGAARPHGHRAARSAALRWQHPGEHRLRQARCHQDASRGGGEKGERARSSSQLPRGLRHRGGRAGHPAQRRPAAAHRHSPRGAEGPGDPDPGRGHQRAGQRERTPGAGGPGQADGRAHQPGDRAPVEHRAPRGQASWCWTRAAWWKAARTTN
jgi:hypothetical protein